jgi:hypothetical protein
MHGLIVAYLHKKRDKRRREKGEGRRVKSEV